MISTEEQKTLVEALGRHGGKPESSKLHIHPLSLAGGEFGDEISVISNQFVFDDKFKRNDFTILDRVGGKTLWVSSHTIAGVYYHTERDSTRTSLSRMYPPITPLYRSVNYHPSAVIHSGHQHTKPTTVYHPRTRLSSRVSLQRTSVKALSTWQPRMGTLRCGRREAHQRTSDNISVLYIP